MRYLHVFVLHEKSLFYRERFLTNTLKTLDNICKKRGYEFCSYELNTDDDVDGELSKEHRSNFSKQRTAIKKIIEMGSKEQVGDKHYYMCLEDDCIFLNQFIENLEFVMENLDTELWDILFLCVCQTDGNVEEKILKDTRTNFKSIPSKECYLINVETATKLLPSLEKMHLSYRMQLSDWIEKHPEILSKFSTKRVSIEGSKVGIVPSSVNDNNILLYNKDFITLFNMINNIDIDQATKIFELSAHLKSPDIIHLYAVLMFKSGRTHEAKELFLEAVDEAVCKNGKLDKGTEILNNAINICGLYQPDRDIYRKEPSKYVQKMI